MANGRRYISFTAASFPTASRRFCVKLVWEQLSAAPLLSLTSGDTGTVDLSSSIKEELSLLSAPRLPELFYFLFFVSLKVSVLREIKSWRMEQHCSPQTVAPLTRLQTGLDVVSCGSWLFRRKKILIMIKKKKKEKKYRIILQAAQLWKYSVFCPTHCCENQGCWLWSSSFHAFKVERRPIKDRYLYWHIIAFVFIKKKTDLKIQPQYSVQCLQTGLHQTILDTWCGLVKFVDHMSVVHLNDDQLWFWLGHI